MLQKPYILLDSKGELSAAVKSLGLHPDSNLLAARVHFILANADYKKISTSQFEEWISQEKAAWQLPQQEKQDALYKIKIAIIAHLDEKRKELRRECVDVGSKSSQTRALDAIEAANCFVESYKPAKPSQDSQDNTIKIPLRGNDEYTARIIRALQKENTAQPETSILELIAKLLLGSIALISLYLTLTAIIDMLAFKFSVPLLLSTTLLLACIILIRQVLNPKEPEKNEKTPQEVVEILGNHNKKWWYLSSIPGITAAFMQQNPMTSIACALTLSGSILFLPLTSLGVSLVTHISIFLGVSYYGTLYTMIPILAFIPVKIGLSIYEAIWPTKKPVSAEVSKPFSINPIARIWQAIDAFLNKFYLTGMQSPIAMLLFSIVYIGIIIQIMLPFLPTGIATVIHYVMMGVVNPSAGLPFAAVCTGWFIGLIILQITDIITRRHESETVKSIDYIQKNPINSILFLAVLMLCAQAAATTALAQLCGNWLILGLITISFKPLLAIADFMMNPRKSTIGSSLTLVFMPIKLILYPGEAIYYLLKLTSQIIAGIFKHILLHIPLVIVCALFDITTTVTSWFSKDAAKKVIDANSSTLLVTQFILKVKHVSKSMQYIMRSTITHVNTLLTMVIGTYCAYMGIISVNYFLLGHLPHTFLLPGIHSLLTWTTGFSTLPTTMTLCALMGCYFALLSVHQLCSPKDMYSTENTHFIMINQVIMAGLVTAFGLITTLQPASYALIVMSTIMTSLVLTIMSACLTRSNPSLKTSSKCQPENPRSPSHFSLSGLFFSSQPQPSSNPDLLNLKAQY